MGLVDDLNDEDAKAKVTAYFDLGDRKTISMWTKTDGLRLRYIDDDHYRPRRKVIRTPLTGSGLKEGDEVILMKIDQDKHNAYVKNWFTKKEYIITVREWNQFQKLPMIHEIKVHNRRRLVA